MTDIGKTVPTGYRALLALHEAAEKAAADAGVDPLTVELVKIRASQLNGCAYCLRMHVRDATSLGESADRLAVVAAWWESQYFTPSEQAALLIAEQVTSPTAGQGHAAVQVRDSLDEAQVAAVTWVAIVINAWNRVAISSHYAVAP